MRRHFAERETDLSRILDGTHVLVKEPHTASRADRRAPVRGRGRLLLADIVQTRQSERSNDVSQCKSELAAGEEDSRSAMNGLESLKARAASLITWSSSTRVLARTVAVRRTPWKTAASPKWSPACSVACRSGGPPFSALLSTSTSPVRIM